MHGFASGIHPPHLRSPEFCYEVGDIEKRRYSKKKTRKDGLMRRIVYYTKKKIKNKKKRKTKEEIEAKNRQSPR